jgi:uncharacterized membrane protein required for colicin V production
MHEMPSPRKTMDIQQLFQLILSPPTAQRLKQLEHLVFLLFVVKFVFRLYALIRMGPAKAWKKIVGAIFGSLKSTSLLESEIPPPPLPPFNHQTCFHL